MEEVRPEQRPAAKWNVDFDAVPEEPCMRMDHRDTKKKRGTYL